jgi:hypothetical protein
VVVFNSKKKKEMWKIREDIYFYARKRRIVNVTKCRIEFGNAFVRVKTCYKTSGVNRGIKIYKITLLDGAHFILHYRRKRLPSRYYRYMWVAPLQTIDPKTATELWYTYIYTFVTMLRFMNSHIDYYLMNIESNFE